MNWILEGIYFLIRSPRQVVIHNYHIKGAVVSDIIIMQTRPWHSESTTMKLPQEVAATLWGNIRMATFSRLYNRTTSSYLVPVAPDDHGSLVGV